MANESKAKDGVAMFDVLFPQFPKEPPLPRPSSSKDQSTAHEICMNLFFNGTKR